MKFVDRAVDHPGTVVCPHCGVTVALPKTEPWIVIDGVPRQPDRLVSLRCDHCRKRIYFEPVTDE